MCNEKLHPLALLLLARGLSLCRESHVDFFKFKSILQNLSLFIAVNVHKS